MQVSANDADEAGGMDGANGVQRSGSGAGRGGKGNRGQPRGIHLTVCADMCVCAVYFVC